MRGKERTPQEKEELIRSIEPYLQLGYSVAGACHISGIPSSTVHDILASDETLRIKAHALQNMIHTKARQNIVEAIQKGSVPLSQWWMNRYEGKPSDNPYYVGVY
jgi:hypothetical protein